MRRNARKICGCVAALLLPLGLSAQTVYRIVEPGGRVVFTDQLPTTPLAEPKVLGSSSRDGAGSPESALPFELRQLARQYPVTLITASGCAPCDAARNWLSARGIPYSEKKVSTAEDMQALRRLSGADNLPLLNLGSQQLKGFSDAEWTQYLDAAGYPKTSQLPMGYKNPAPVPLVEVKKAELADKPAAAASSAAGTGSSANTPTPAGNNPAGIRF